MADVPDFRNSQFTDLILLISFVALIQPFQAKWNTFWEMSAFPHADAPTITNKSELNKAWSRFYYINKDHPWMAWTGFIALVAANALHVGSFYILLHQYASSPTATETEVDRYNTMVDLQIIITVLTKMLPLCLQVAIVRQPRWHYICAAFMFVTWGLIASEAVLLYVWSATLSANLFIAVAGLYTIVTVLYIAGLRYEIAEGSIVPYGTTPKSTQD